MDIIKQHLFLVILLAATVVIAGAVLFWDSTQQAALAEAVEEREGLADRLGMLARRNSPKPNDQKLQEMEQEVEKGKEQYEKVLRAGLEFNRRYEVLQLKRADTGQSVPAFPFDRQLDARVNLKETFVSTFRQALDGLRASLETTTPPAPDAQPVPSEIDRRFEQLRQERREGLSPEQELSQDVLNELRERAARIERESMVASRANRGQLYMDAAALDDPIGVNDRRPPMERMWNAQVSLWIQQDVIDAIRSANRQAFEDLDESERTVAAAAVKRLVRIDVQDSYFMGQESTDSGGQDYYDEQMLTGEMGGRPMPGARRSSRTRTSTAPQQAESLTQAVCNEQRDIVHYTVELVMPFHLLPLFQDALMKRNFHTMLDMELSPVVDPLAAGYYYGPSPVHRIVMTWELKLKTEWSRPLVPVEVLQTTLEPVLRPEDRQRVDEMGRQGNTGMRTGR